MERDWKSFSLEALYISKSPPPLSDILGSGGFPVRIKYALVMNFWDRSAARWIIMVLSQTYSSLFFVAGCWCDEFGVLSLVS